MKIKPFVEKGAASTAVVHENPLLNRIYQNRGVTSPDDINYGLSKMLSPALMLGMDKATDILINHILADSRILVIGDYDCDGATSTSIAVEGLTLLGAKNVSYLIPDRIIHGYGLTKGIVDIAGTESPDLIITVDNGISAFDGALAVKSLNHPCQLIITDHHLATPDGRVPDADAIVNPNQNSCRFPSKSIAGCGVIFCVMVALRTKMREQNIFNKIQLKEPRLNQLLDLLALGTIADVVSLDYNNRIFVSAGLDWINQGNCRPGLRKILELKGKQIGKIVATDFGFSAGPCINAAGRLDDMSIGIKCLLERNAVLAEDYATRLYDLNEQRKEIESHMVEGALDFIDSIDSADTDGIVIYNEHWHEGVVGIVASRIKDKFDRPVICFTDTHELADAKERYEAAVATKSAKEHIEEMKSAIDNYDIKGSARSIHGIHLKHLLDELSKVRPDILSKFGGHAMAAGLSIKHGDLDEFKSLFNNLVKREMTNEMKIGSVSVDIKQIDPELLTIDNAELLEAQPVWGQNFEQPLFSQCFEVISKKILKEKHIKYRLKIKGSDSEFDAIAFGCVDRGVEPVDQEMEASFKLTINEFRGNRTVQLMISHLQDEAYQKSREKAQQENPESRNINGVAKTQGEELRKKKITTHIDYPF